MSKFIFELGLGRSGRSRGSPRQAWVQPYLSWQARRPDCLFLPLLHTIDDSERTQDAQREVVLKAQDEVD